jgi:sirohydrochlorin ferrochelatase
VIRRGAATLAAAALLACGSPPPARAVHVAHRPPTAKDVIDAAIASGSLPLSVSATCHGVGTEPSDATIGRYLAGFLAEMSASDKKNWIETSVEAGTSAGGEAGSFCTLTLRHEDGDDRWGWGVKFFVRSSDGLVVPSSFTCVGAG